MTCDIEYRCDTAVPDDPALAWHWTEDYEFTAGRVRFWDDDTVQDDKFAAQSALAGDLSDTQRAYWGGVLFAVMEFLGERPCPGCDRKEAA
jgi:hypothetical protein